MAKRKRVATNVVIGMVEAERPPTIRIGGFDYEVITDQGILQNGHLGEYDELNLQIRLAPGMAPEMERNVTIHEALHGIFSQAGEREHDERVIDFLAAGIMQLFRDNPWLAQSFK